MWVFSPRRIAVGAAVLCFTAIGAAQQQQPSNGGDAEVAKIKNPVEPTADSIAAGKKVYEVNCASCHGADAKGGLTISVIEDRGGKQPPDLVDDKWDHGSTDGEIFTVIKKGVAPDFFMIAWGGQLSDTDIWNVVNYLRSLAPNK
jgi:mono/diheme cytochrome c family protein